MDADEIRVTLNRLVYVNRQFQGDYLAIRTSGQFKDAGFYLSNLYEWVIGVDNENDVVLVPLKKDEK